MSETYLLKREQLVPASLEKTFAFFADAGNLEAITPPWLHFHILTPKVEIKEGAEIRYKLRWRGVPIWWKTLITKWEEPMAFEDFQVSGPYKLWHHRHTFVETDKGTLMTDIVRYELPFGWIGRLAHWLAVKKNVEAIFDYRYEKIAEIFQS